MSKRILLSFKNTAKDNELYQDIMGHSSPSAFIKDSLSDLKKKQHQTYSPIVMSAEINNILKGIE